MPKFLGLTFMNMILVSIFGMSCIIGGTVLAVDDEKVRRQAIV